MLRGEQDIYGVEDWVSGPILKEKGEDLENPFITFPKTFKGGGAGVLGARATGT